MDSVDFEETDDDMFDSAADFRGPSNTMSQSEQDEMDGTMDAVDFPPDSIAQSFDPSDSLSGADAMPSGTASTGFDSMGSADTVQPTIAGDEQSWVSPEQASGFVDNMKQSASDMGDTVKQKAQEFTEQAQSKAGQMMGTVKSQVVSQVTTQKERASSKISEISSALHQTGQQLDQNGQAPIGDIAETVATRIDSVSSYLRERNVDDMLMDGQDFARRQPALFIGLAVILGVMIARFMKSSAPQQDMSSQSMSPSSMSPQSMNSSSMSPAM